MYKKIMLLAILAVAGMQLTAQYGRERRNDYNTYENDTEFGPGFKKEHMFIGGNIGLGFGSYTFNAGASPELGYSFSNWFDAGVLVNLNYNSMGADPSGYYNDNTRQRSFNYGAGVFARAWPLPMFFLQAGTENNWIYYNYKTSTGVTYSGTTNAQSILVGAGYGQRIVGHSSFHIAILVDLMDKTQSPYRYGNGAIMPVIKTGFDFYFKPKHK